MADDLAGLHSSENGLRRHCIAPCGFRIIEVDGSLCEAARVTGDRATTLVGLGRHVKNITVWIYSNVAR